MKKIKKAFLKTFKILIPLFVIILTIVLISYLNTKSRLENTASGVAINTQTQPNHNYEIGKFYNDKYDMYSVYGKYLILNDEDKWIGLLGTEGSLWRIDYDESTYFNYESSYKDKTKGISIYSFTYKSKETFLKDTRFGMMIRVHCVDKMCNQANGIVVYDKTNKYNYK